MEDIRLLKLFKQHYQDAYSEPLVTKYSSLGYYDGFEVVKVDDTGCSKLFTAEAEAPFSALYYGVGREIAGLNAGKSLQLIGLFRCEDPGENDAGMEFWEMAESFPYFAIGFLKVSGSEYIDSARRIEGMCGRSFEPQNEKGCRCLTYLTYDNADLIVLMTGNSIEYMMENLQRIERDHQFSYMHNIFGVSEELLRKSKEEGRILDTWNSVCCNIDEPIKCIEMKLVTSGDGNHILNGIKHVLDKENDVWTIRGYENLTYTYISGHENLTLKLNETDVRSLLALLTPGGFSTHQNIMYKNGVYNIETSVCLKENKLTDLTGEYTSEPGKNIAERIWCQQLIRKYSVYTSRELEAGDEGFYSYFQSLLMTLNTLNQYERFQISRDVFFMIYPALDLFDKMFTKAYQDLGKSSDECCRIKKLKDALCDFITYVNSVIYHTIHTDQVFLMIPGYSGTSYSIPIKLNMMYYWFIDAIKNVLNDGGINFQCILVPDMEANPKSNLFDFGIETEDRLIYVNFSQRTLFLPRSLMIILAHEIAHYVGRDIRLREKRWEHLLNSVCGCIVESIVRGAKMIKPQNEQQKAILTEYTESVMEKLKTVILKFLKAFCETKLNGDFHGKRVIEVLNKGIHQMIALENSDMENVIRELPVSIKTKLKAEETFCECSSFIYEVQTSMLTELRGIMYFDWMKIVLSLLMHTYREVFSDMAALAITECDFRDFCEAHQVSEGVIISEDNVAEEQCMRELTVNQIVYGMKEKVHMHGFGVKKKEPYVLYNLYAYEWIRKEIIQYAGECYQVISERLKKPEIVEITNDVRELFSVFVKKRNDCLSIQKEINLVIEQHMKKVEEKYNNLSFMAECAEK